MKQGIPEIVELPWKLNRVVEEVHESLPGAEPELSLDVDIPPLKLVVAGGRDSGKSAFLNALLEPQSHGLTPADENTGPDTTFPIEYVYAPRPRIRVCRRDRSGQSEWKTVAAGAPPLDIENAVEEGRNDPDISKVRVELSSELLQKWQLELVDMPSVTGDADNDRRLLEFIEEEEPEAVLYLLHMRGASDLDRHFASNIRAADELVFLTNVRQKSLHPDFAALELLNAPIPNSSLLFCPPVDLLKVKQKKSPEFQLFAQLLGFIRHSQLEEKFSLHEAELEGVCERLQQTANSRFRKAADLVRTSKEALSVMEGGSEFLQLEADLETYEQVNREIRSAFASISHSQQRDNKVRVKVLSKQADSLVKNYNVEAGSRRSTSKKERDWDTELAEDLVKLRNSLANFLDNLAEQSETLGMGDDELDYLYSLKKRILDSRVELALLGMFSSGKSTLINAFLGAIDREDGGEFLPTNIQAETSTVNRIEYADTPRLIRIDWLSEVTLEFFSKPQEQQRRGLFGDGYRVHSQEIRAFCEWLDEGTIRLADCTFEHVSPQKRRATIEDGKAYENLRTWVQQRSTRGGDLPTFLYPKQYGQPVPTSVTIPQFLTSPPEFDEEEKADLEFVFSKIEQPRVALRVDKIRLGYPCELLKHAAIIDTPGTDSGVPHHRIIARQIVAERACPVLYCFRSDQAAGREDRKNIHQASTSDKEREIFFTITAKGQHDTEDRKEIREFVREQLRELRVSNPNPYFVEVIEGKDPEFKQLRDEVSSYLREQQRPQFQSWIEEVRDLVEAARQRAAKGLEALEKSQEEREQKAAALETNLSELREFVNIIRSSDDKGIPWVRRRVRERVDASYEQIENELEELTEPEMFENVEEAVIPPVDRLNDAVSGNLRKSAQALAGRIRSRIAEITGDTEVASTPEYAPPDDDFFSSAELSEAISNVSWPSFWFFRFPSTKKEAVEKNQKKLQKAWNKSRRSGEELIEEELDKIEERFTTYLDVVEERLEDELASLKSVDESGDQEKYSEMSECAENWLIRLEDLEEQFDDSLA